MNDFLITVIFLGTVALLAIFLTGCATPTTTEVDREMARATAASLEAEGTVGACAVTATRCADIQVFTGRAAVSAAGERSKTVNRSTQARQTK